MISSRIIRRLIVSAALSFAGLNAATVDTVSIRSAAMDTILQTIIVIPNDSSRLTESRPVLYLLHGWSGDFSNWHSHTDLGGLADRFGCIIVCPEGGYASWYFDSPVRPRSQFSTFIGEELIHWVDGHYKTINTPGGRAITGLSMGGHGALYIAITHPGVFGGAGSMSGVLNLEDTRFYGEILNLLGLKKAGELHRFSFVGLIDRLTNEAPAIIIDCGFADPYLPTNREAHRLLLENKIDHTYMERPGGHSWDFWTNALEYHLLFFRKSLNWAIPAGGLNNN